jgi:hypothetical protein
MGGDDLALLLRDERGEDDVAEDGGRVCRGGRMFWREFRATICEGDGRLQVSEHTRDHKGGCSFGRNSSALQGAKGSTKLFRGVMYRGITNTEEV